MICVGEKLAGNWGMFEAGEAVGMKKKKTSEPAYSKVLNSVVPGSESGC